MEVSTVVICAIIIVFGLGGLYLYAYFKDKRSAADSAPLTNGKAMLPLQLQAYERLVILADRISLPNLVSRVNQTGLTAKEMQMLLTQTIKQEFEHNISQQIYVSSGAWEAINNLKEQNILVINQVSSFLPENASGIELNKGLMQLLMENPKASLHTIVSEALSHEAKKLM
ncbi:MAG: hypothetical protein ABIN89_20785 [Chitinophagaceae bacterium]